MHYLADQRKGLPRGLMPAVNEHVRDTERLTGKGFGAKNNPHLVSVRSGAALSMLGMMDAMLNLGPNKKTLSGLTEQTGNYRFVLDSYRRFIRLFGKVALGIPETWLMARRLTWWPWSSAIWATTAVLGWRSREVQAPGKRALRGIFRFCRYIRLNYVSCSAPRFWSHDLRSPGPHHCKMTTTSSRSWQPSRFNLLGKLLDGRVVFNRRSDIHWQ